MSWMLKVTESSWYTWCISPVYFLLFKRFYRVRLILTSGTGYRLIPPASVRYHEHALIPSLIPDTHCVCVTKAIVLCLDCAHQTKKKNNKMKVTATAQPLNRRGSAAAETFISGYRLFTSVSVIISSCAMFFQLSISLCLSVSICVFIWFVSEMESMITVSSDLIFPLITPTVCSFTQPVSYTQITHVSSDCGSLSHCPHSSCTPCTYSLNSSTIVVK